MGPELPPPHPPTLRSCPAQSGPCIERPPPSQAQADELFHSWAYWQYKHFKDPTTICHKEGLVRPNGTLVEAKVAALARPYARAVQGRGQRAYLDPRGRYVLKYKVRDGAGGGLGGGGECAWGARPAWLQGLS